jgi:O-antigen/teichoic acid export membrane protein
VKLLNSTLAVGLAIALNLILIPPLGLVGAAIASFGSIATVNLLRVAEVGWLVKVGPYDASWAKPLLAGAAAAAVGLGTATVTDDLVGALAAAALGAVALGLTYAAVLPLLGLTDDDRTIVSRAARKITRRGGRPGSMARADAPVKPS